MYFVLLVVIGGFYVMSALPGRLSFLWPHLVPLVFGASVSTNTHGTCDPLAGEGASCFALIAAHKSRTVINVQQI